MLKSTLKFARLRIVASCYALVFLGSAAAGDIAVKAILALILLIAITIHANSINDYADQDIDKVNLKNATDRPLVSGDISLHGFWAIHFASGITALLLSIFYGSVAILLTSGVLLADYVYSLRPLRLAYRPIASPILLSAAYVYYSFTMGYLSVHTSRAYPWLLSLGLFVGFVARMLLKDFRDVKGDKKHGKLTFLIRYGARSTCLVSGLLWLLAMLVIIKAIGFAIGIVVPLFIGVLMVSLMLQSLSTSTKIDEQQKIVTFIAKPANFSIITLLAYLLCKNQTGLSNAEIQIIPAVIGSVLLLINWLDYLDRRRVA